MDDQQRTRLTATISGTVQGVGFRYYTREKARQLNLTGVASNRPDGSVLIVAEGPETAIRSLVGWLNSTGAPGRVENVVESYSEPAGEFTDFRTE
ncbi:acylphosphatase [Arthrobacter sp. CAN_A212]|uniref:acylphosphatase n=1 Tax=unclassified Arthrobacter TaxID=235627 RepID=UPI0018CB965C|nr:acylphosphatase [Arthrobacter sp. CAN_C5]MBP2215182.1 acylphosphatase [Arthrobacter sp. CAN_C5]